MLTSETLNLAADLIQQRGWTQGPNGWMNHDDAPLCLEGGIAAVVGISPQGLDFWRFRGCPAYRAVVDYLGDREIGHVAWDGVGRRDLYLFNDVKGRTAAEVVEVLRATAVIEAARENESAQVTA